MREMAVLDELLVRLGVDMSEAESEVERGTDGITGQLDGLSVAGGAAAAGLGAAFAVGLESAMDISAATDKLKQGLGLTQEEADRAGKLSGEVFSAGFGESMEGVADAMGSVIGAMGKVGDFTDAELTDMTKSATALEKVFGMDIPEATNAAGALLKQGLVKDGTEAFDVLTKAAQTLPSSMAADIPAIVSEYGTHFKRIGLDAAQAFGMMSQFVQAGGRDIDQAADVLHEFARITSEETKRAADGFKALGLDADKMLSDIGKGGKPAADALALTLDALRGVKDPAQQAQLGIALFGDMAGEAAGALLAMNPETAKAATGMDDVAGAAKGVTDSMAASPAQQWESIMRTLTTTLGQMLLPALRFVSELFKEHPALVQTLIPIVLVLASALAIAAVAQWAMNSAVLAFPGTWIILAILAIVVALVSLWRKNEAFRNFVKAAWSVILGAIMGAWNWVKNNWPLLLAILTGPIGLAVLAITRNWDSIVKFFAGIPGRLAALGKGMWEFVTDGLKGALNNAIGLINAGIWTINSELIGNANRIPGVNIPYIPYIPYLAEGGITTGPTMAMIGEGSEDEAVMPLSKLQSVIDMNTAAGARGASRMATGQRPLVLELRGGSRAFREFFQESVQTTTGGDVIKYVGG